MPELPRLANDLLLLKYRTYGLGINDLKFDSLCRVIDIKIHIKGNSSVNRDNKYGSFFPRISFDSFKLIERVF